MAGEVKVDLVDVPGGLVQHLMVRHCPATERFGEVCLAYDPHTAEVTVCPFWYGMVIEEGSWHTGEARDLTEARVWLASGELYSIRRYTVRCLRKESAGVRVGALRPRG